MGLIGFFVRVLLFVVASLPLHLSVKLLGGKTNLIKSVLVNLITGIIISALMEQFRILGGFVAFLFLVFIYHEVFRLRWIKALFVWLVQLIIVAIFYAILILIGASAIITGGVIMNVL